VESSAVTIGESIGHTFHCGYW